MRNRSVVLLWAFAAATAWGVDTPREMSAGGDEGLRQAFERAAYSLEASGNGAWRGVNPAERLTLEFDGQEARLRHPNGSVSFQLSGYGYGNRLRIPARARLTAKGNRVEYRRGNLTEWYVNGSQGLEQGFTLTRRPGTHRASEPLLISLAVSGGLTPAQRADEGGVVFESATGAVLRYAGLRAVDARGLVLPSRMEVRGGEIRLLVEDQGAQYPLIVDPTWTQQQKLTAPAGALHDFFGYSVSVSGDTAVIGASAPPGAAYVFVRSGGLWTQQQELTSSDGAAYDGFGASVSVSGDTAVIGAEYEGGGRGAAYVFVRSGGAWTQQQKLTASDGAAWDSFGISVSVSGDTAAIGAAGKNGFQGAAYVFVRSGGAWTQQQELTASDGVANDSFGTSVSVSGDTTVIGAIEKNNFQGAAYVFLRNGTVWTQQQELTASDGAPEDWFGFSVSVSGDTTVIGAGQKNNAQGAAYVFLRSGTVWTQQAELTASDGAANDYFGYTVSVSGETAVIGANGKNSLQGAAYVFVRSGGVWGQQQELTASDGAAYDFFGYSVSVSGDTAVIGAYGKNGCNGAAYIFVRPRLGANTLLLPSAAGSSSVLLSYSGPRTAVANSSFLHLSAGSASGAGNALVVFTYDAFTGTGSRTGTLTIAGLTLTVTQAGTNYLGPGPVIGLTGAVNQPNGVAVDASGNVYIADTRNNAIREWSASTGQVITLLSTGPNSPSGVAVDGSGNVYFTDAGAAVVKEWSAGTGQVTTLVSSGLNTPWGLAVDSLGNVYIADSGNNAIKEWNASTGQVIAVVSSAMSSPYGVAVDAFGNVYFTDAGSSAIKEWNASTGQVTALVSSGLSSPYGVAVDGSGNVYIADVYNGAIKQWSAATGQVTTLNSSELIGPSAVAVDASGNVYIAQPAVNAIEEIPYAFVGPAGLTEPASAGSDSLLPVLPATEPLTGIFQPLSQQFWLVPEAGANGAVSFSFTANLSSTRVGQINVLGQSITVTQNGPLASLAPATTSVVLGNSACNNSQNVALTSTVAGAAVAFTVAVSYPNAANDPTGGNWLYASIGGSGATSTGAPFSSTTGASGETLNISLNHALFAASDWAQVILTPTGSGVSTTPIAITVNYDQNTGCAGGGGSATNGFITVTPGSVSLTAKPGGEEQQALTIRNNTGQTLVFSPAYSGETVGGVSWLTVTANSAVLPPGGTATVIVTANAARLTSTGTYHGYVAIVPSLSQFGGAIEIPVTFAVTASGSGTGPNSGTLTLNGAASNVYNLSLTYTPSGPPLSALVGIQDSAPGANSYGYQVATTSGGSWLLANYTTSGTAYGPLASGAQASVQIGTSSVLASLPSGAYRGSVALTSSSGSTATINVTLYVNTTGAAGGITVSPGVVFVFPGVPVNSTALESQQFSVSASAGISLGTATPAGAAGSWFRMSSPTSYGNAQFFAVYANPSGLAAGIYSTTITVASTGGQSGTTTILVVLPVGQGLPQAQQFYPLTPCRVADTRVGAGFAGAQGPPYLSGGTSRNFAVAGNCGVPANATAYSLNVTVVPRTGELGFLTTWPAGQTMPLASTLNAPVGQVVANAALVPAGTNGDIGIYASDDTDVLFDIDGYFAPPASGLQFYPLTPCRVADTRVGAGFTGTQGPPYLSGGISRNFAVAGSCGVPATAAAYSLNVTVVPRTDELGFLTTWPAGQTKPWASTLNSPAGAVVANAALVPAGTNGDIGIFASDNTDVLFDINGYFAPPSASGLDYYAMTPCRVADTRSGAGFPGQFGPPTMGAATSRSFAVQSGVCNVPSVAAAYALNVTAAPSAGVLNYLTTWPAGQPQPWASTLNSPDGMAVANAALVPAGTAGAIGIYVSDPADVLFDINGFFAPGQ